MHKILNDSFLHVFYIAFSLNILLFFDLFILILNLHYLTTNQSEFKNNIYVSTKECNFGKNSRINLLHNITLIKNASGTLK